VFTGIVERVGKVLAMEAGGRLRVDLGPIEARTGDSISVAGVCLTLTAPGTFDVVRETLGRTTLGSLKRGSTVNLEPALRMGDRLGGHFVQGHVDGTGTVRSMDGPDGAVVLSVSAPKAVTENLIEKGSVAVDGVALTVVTLDPEGFTVALVPHTLKATTLGGLRPGDRVNLEADLIGKWVRRILGRDSRPSGLTRETLEAEGFG